MTLEEAEKIARLISMADGGCHHCIEHLTKEAGKAFPEFTFAMTSERWSRTPEWAADWDEADAVESFPLVTVVENGKK